LTPGGGLLLVQDGTAEPPSVRAEMALPLHVIAPLGCRRWCCHSVQDHRAKACNDDAYGCHVHPCCSTSCRSHISGRQGAQERVEEEMMEW
jgi:hypothetical protein